MAQQSYGSAPSRDASSAAGIQSKIKLPAAHPSTVTASGEGKAPVTAGPSVQGFSGTGTIKAFIK